MNRPRPRSEHVVVTRVREADGTLVTTTTSDIVVVEEPMSIRLDGTLVATRCAPPGTTRIAVRCSCFGFPADNMLTTVVFVES